MRVTWRYCGSDSESHFADLDIPEVPGPGGGSLTELLEADDVRWFDSPDSAVELGLHPVPQRQLVFLFTGMMEVEASDGTRWTFVPGEILLADDTEGPGHITRTPGASRSAWIRVAKTIDPGKWVAK